MAGMRATKGLTRADIVLKVNSSRDKRSRVKWRSSIIYFDCFETHCRWPRKAGRAFNYRRWGVGGGGGGRGPANVA